MKIQKIIYLIILAVFLLEGVSALTYCCEKTAGTNPFWCQEVNSEPLCSTATNPINDQQFRVSPTSCDATDYCQSGTCIDGEMGICMPNTQKIVCEKENGYWSPQPKDEIQECQLGCCLIGDQAAFVTKPACDKMYEAYSVPTNFVASINNELDCLANANPRAKGACVFTKDLVKTCEVTTKKQCTDKQKSSSLSDVFFRAGLLCSAPELMTNCGETSNTACDEKDDVRFVDKCGNLANVYDWDKAPNNPNKDSNYKDYWTYIKNETPCGDGEGNKDSATCGNCDYLSGSMCKKKARGESVNAGDYICKDLDCKDYNGKLYSGSFDYPHHGETWCATSSTTGNDDAPGATDFRMMCYNGEVTNVECEVTRQKICSEIPDEETGYMFANCRVNRWEDCIFQNTSTECSDLNVRDCAWLPWEGYPWNGYYFSSGGGLKNDKDSDAPKGICIPLRNPGFERDTNKKVIGGEICGAATSTCYVGTPLSGADCDKNNPNMNCSCLDKYDGESNTYVWKDTMNAICTSIGDCGNEQNYRGDYGYQFENVIKVERVETKEE